MFDHDDDVPPPLSSLPEQLEAVKLREQGGARAQGRTEAGQTEEEGLRVASTVVVHPGNSAVKELKTAVTLKKGFFDSAPSKTKSKPALPKAAADGIPMLVGKKQAMGGSGASKVPDFFKVEPDEAAKKYEQMKSQLVDALKPTPDLVEGITNNPQLLAGFDDPEVMAAVNDVAQNPQSMKKYQNNPKVVAFYTAMAQMAGQKLEKMGAAKPSS